MSRTAEFVESLAETLLDFPQDTCEGRCSDELYANGRAVAIVVGPRASIIEGWVQAVRAQARLPIDWHFFGGRAVILAICETPEQRGRVRRTLDLLVPVLAWVYHVHQVRDGSVDQNGTVFPLQFQHHDGEASHGS